MLTVIICTGRRTSYDEHLEFVKFQCSSMSTKRQLGGVATCKFLPITEITTVSQYHAHISHLSY
jgi:hypothetical protein